MEKKDFCLDWGVGKVKNSKNDYHMKEEGLVFVGIWMKVLII